MSKTSKRAWQKLEERVCLKFGGRRTPLSGSNSQHGTSADCIETDYPWLYIEIKPWASFLHHTIFKQAAKAAQKEGKTPILVTHVKNEDSELVTLKIEDFLRILHSRGLDIAEQEATGGNNKEMKKEIKGWNPVDEGEIYMLLNHCIERLPNLKEGLAIDCVNEGHITISFESPKFIITMRLERKKEAK